MRMAGSSCRPVSPPGCHPPHHVQEPGFHFRSEMSAAEELSLSGFDHPQMRRRHAEYSSAASGAAETDKDDDDSERMQSIEVTKIENNRRFGFKKWKSRVTRRPLESRSQIVKELYSEPKVFHPPRGYSTCSFGNVLYVFLFGWWLACAYVLVGIAMALTIVAFPHAKFCFQLASYFFWPFGKFVLKIPHSSRKTLLTPDAEIVNPAKSHFHGNATETTSLIESSIETSTSTDERPSVQLQERPQSRRNFWCLTRPSAWVWFLLGCPLLLAAHFVALTLSWFVVVFIPVSKINMIAMKSVLFRNPDSLVITKQGLNVERASYEVILCSYQAVNIYYYKYTVEGMNVILVNLLPVVVAAILIGFLDKGKDPLIPSLVKFLVALVAVIPLAYYIGMAITSIAAQSNFAVGAVLNATFGSIVEIILYVSAMIKGHKAKTVKCYIELVKSALTGTLLATMLLIPGLCMIVGGLKHREQTFNSRSAGISSSLLFVSVAGAFSPTLFAISYPIAERVNTTCMSCSPLNESSSGRITFECSDCISNTTIPTDQDYEKSDYMKPLSLVCACILPIAYIAGLLFTLKTHKHIHKLAQNDVKSSKSAHHSYAAEWSRFKGFFILLCATVLMALVAEVIVDNIQSILGASTVSEAFIGVTLLALVPDLPEIVNGIQFALQNNIALSIEVGSSIAVQVCLLQIPVLVFVEMIYPVGFVLRFNNVSLWSVLMSTLLMNYTYMDGKSDYFQGTVYFESDSIYWQESSVLSSTGSALVTVYFILIAMFYFIPKTAGKC
eukprot:m.90491 g.90491  ORF g.90491 m.90491 type:complete len:783 (+) comp36650_c0_seq13:547-2895(+)